jgi:uncharacterized protein
MRGPVLAAAVGLAVLCGSGAVRGQSQLEAAAEAFVDLLVAGDFEAAEKPFDLTMKGVLPAAKLEQTWNTLVGQVGGFQQKLGSRTERQAAYDIVYVSSRFERAVIDVKVVFDAERRIAGLFFTPGRDPAPAAAPTVPADAPFTGHEVTLGDEPWKLPGTLLVPKGDGPFPALVLVHGSGPQDRDQTIGPNKPFRDLAEGLAARGVAVLRYEKRTREHISKLAVLPKSFTVQDETVDDALAAVELLRKSDDIDPQRIFVLGHSLGGMLAPRIGRQDPKIAGLIIAAGLTRPLDETILDQVAYVTSISDELTEAQQTQLETLRTEMARLPGLSAEDTEPILGIPPAYWLDLRDYRPAEAARDVPQRMLILHGGRDYQVIEADFEAWKAALGARKDVRFELYPDLNHLFMRGEGKATPAEYSRAGAVDERLIEHIAEWIRGG